MNNEKVVGYILLSIGIVVILFSVLSVYQVFTRNAQPIQLFNFSGISLNLSQIIPLDKPSKTQPAPAAELVPAEMINQTSNVFAHLLLMGFVASIGYKIASLGVMLLRPVQVKLKTDK